jgi:hypothetical protein
MDNQEPGRSIVYDFEDCSVVHAPYLLDQVQHFHPALEISFLLSPMAAEIHWWDRDRQHDHRPLFPGQICIIPSNQDHALRVLQPAELLMFYFQPACLSRIARQCNCDAAVEFPAHAFSAQAFSAHYAIADEFIWQLGITLHQELKSPTVMSSIYANQLITCFVMRLLRQYSNFALAQSTEEDSHAAGFKRSLDADWAEAQS